MTDHVVIVGAGQAGAQTAISLRQLGFDGRISLLGDELFPPYQRPPLSKKLMTGEMDVERTYIRSAGLLRQERGGSACWACGSPRSIASAAPCCARTARALRLRLLRALHRHAGAPPGPAGRRPAGRLLPAHARGLRADQGGGRDRRARGDHRRRLYRPRDRREPQQVAVPGDRAGGAGAGAEPRRGAARIRLLRRRACPPRRRDRDRRRGRSARGRAAGWSGCAAPTAACFRPTSS